MIFVFFLASPAARWPPCERQPVRPDFPPYNGSSNHTAGAILNDVAAQLICFAISSSNGTAIKVTLGCFSGGRAEEAMKVIF